MLKDLALSLLWLWSLLWLRFHPWPWNFHVPWTQLKKKSGIVCCEEPLPTATSGASLTLTFPLAPAWLLLTLASRSPLVSLKLLHPQLKIFFFFKFPGQGLNLRHSSDPSHGNDNAESLTYCTTRKPPELQI